MSNNSLKKAAAALAASLLAATGLLTVSAGAAQASGQSVRIHPLSNPFVYLDVSGGSKGDGAKIIQWSLGGDNQVFTLQPYDNHFELVNRNSGKCITTDGVAGHQLYQWLCKGAPGQLWDTGLTASSTTVYNIVSVASGLVMDVAGGSSAQGAAIDTWYWNRTDNQWFGALAA